MQQRQTMGFLEKLCTQKRTKQDDIAQYVRLFSTTAKALEGSGDISANQKCKWFLKGLPEYLQEKAALAGGLISSNRRSARVKKLDFEKIVNHITNKLRARKELEMLDTPNNVNQLVKEAVARLKISNRTDIAFRGLVQLVQIA